MQRSSVPWYKRPLTKSDHFRSIPFRRIWTFTLAVFFLFSAVGFYTDLMQSGRIPYAIAIFIAVFSGCIAVLYALVFTRLPRWWLGILVVIQIPAWTGLGYTINWLIRIFHLQPVGTEPGIKFAATCILFAIIASYCLFITFIRVEGKETFRLRNELDLAHAIQKTLVPVIALRTSRFEMYGVSEPSAKVGGDLVDAVALANGDAIAYVADIAGHGLDAGILMGMLKTAARTVLLDADCTEPAATLPILLDRLNRVLPEVKEQHMYATFAGLRLNADGRVFYSLAASPPLLYWSHARGAATLLSAEQFPLGLLPVSSFDGAELGMESGDLLVVATDGLLEVSKDGKQEFGFEGLRDVIQKHASQALPDLAGSLLGAVRTFGRQSDDQTVLLIRCL